MAFKNKVETLKRNDLLTFLAMLTLAFTVSLIPVLHIPFSWMNTFFHEISHGLATLLTGGSIKTIELNINGSGICWSNGGIRFFTAFSGYAGAVIWGAVIYVMADNSSPKSADRIAIFIISLLSITLVLWARDLTTSFILILMIIPFAVILKTKELAVEKYFMQFSGLYIVLDALKTPTYLLDGGKRGDGATLQELTWLPEIVWILIWLCLGVLTLLFLFRRHIKYEHEKSKTPRPKKLKRKRSPKRSA
ncbi:MAG: M50 family metallopeptidase [Alphaproteobacteria bacterium]